MSAEISFKEVKNHKDKKSVWMVIHNQVYDVTKFLEEHPGGEDALLEYAGKNGTQAFEDVGHSEDARELMIKYKIGTLPSSEQAKEVAKNCKPSLAESKSWRTFDGSPASYRQEKIKSPSKKPTGPTAEKHVDAIVVPVPSVPVRESDGDGGGGTLKWALLALAGAIIIGIVLRKYMS